MIAFDSIIIDREKMMFIIKNGTVGTYNIGEIIKISLCLEQASFKEKTKPFLHQVIPGTSFFSAIEPKLYVGIKINDDLAIYVSKVPVLYNSDLYLKDVKEAKKIIKLLRRSYE